MDLVVKRLRVSRRGRTLVDDLNFAVRPHDVWAVVGPNGSGKSSLLLTLAGELAPASGEIILDDRPLASWRAGERAERIAWQGALARAEFGFTIADRLAVVLAHRRTVGEALERLELDRLASRRLEELSAGERQRVELAALWRRDAPIWLLDEPTAHLDLAHQVRWLEIVREERRNGRAFVLVLHDLTQAHAIAGRAVLLRGDGRARSGSAARLLTTEELQKLYGTPVHRVTGPGGADLLPAYPKHSHGGGRSQ
jgi:ABC-type cobalamin/Fe3+-siderophores transport system ATPase subunit